MGMAGTDKHPATAGRRQVQRAEERDRRLARKRRAPAALATELRTNAAPLASATTASTHAAAIIAGTTVGTPANARTVRAAARRRATALTPSPCAAIL